MYAQRLTIGVIDSDVNDWVIRGFGMWVSNKGTLSLERCLGLPNNPKNLKKAIRDYWLSEASKLINANSISAKAKLLKSLAIRFEAREWQIWKLKNTPPERANELQGMLFFALKGGDSFPLSERQYIRIITMT